MKSNESFATLDEESESQSQSILSSMDSPTTQGRQKTTESQLETTQMPQVPLLGSVAERRAKLTEKLKQVGTIRETINSNSPGLKKTTTTGPGPGRTFIKRKES